MINEVIIYTDGSGNYKKTKDGGAASIFLFNDGKTEHYKELMHHYSDTTSNRMEIWAVINALEYINKNFDSAQLKVKIYSDSQYVVSTMMKWINMWLELGILRMKKNNDLFYRLLTIQKQFKSVKYIWVKGHDIDELNNYVDVLSKKASQLPTKIRDVITEVKY